ncbi:MAG: ATP-binding cassette domain-containing protein [Lactobacillales bacterium]|jgi:ABC-type multidrug transport system ATPase subunit|nr:ATP-binding cassette domain-containing protein [Lactobacillales bacterium]
MKLLKINKLDFSYVAEETLLYIQDLSFPSKAIVKLEGKNGTGKTTFLNLLSDCLEIFPKECNFLFDNNEYKKFSTLRKQRVFANDKPYFFENLTLKEQISFFIYILNLKTCFIQRAKEYCERLELLKYSNRKIKDLSLGTKQKLSLACLLAMEVPFYFLDEPLNSLDYQSKKIIKDIIVQKFHHQPACLFIIVSHEEDERALYTHSLSTSDWKLKMLSNSFL